MIMSRETGGCGSVVSGMHVRVKLASSEARVLRRTPLFVVFLRPLCVSLELRLETPPFYLYVPVHAANGWL